ncbi:hypothetical protein FRC14_000509 [Serendipita sp. 396]|nr:hypothetical protein FRC14_000509 [Serendipita sp. 396]KAG8788363.1 hypothetical protein FRC15_004643 [Serendipita sp. 397]KAG8803402.1 hypothetical protein FRC16_005599 [Serendipita sp. 398]
MASISTQDSESQSFRNHLPSYEEMIIETLGILDMPQGARPKDIYDYMMERWPLIPNFRPSASQALQRALKRGRLIKNGALYSLNPNWSEKDADGAITPRPMTKYPASTLAPRPPPVQESEVSRGSNGNLVHGPKPGESHIPPDTKATVQAAASLLRTISIPIRDLVDDQPTPYVPSLRSTHSASKDGLDRRVIPNRSHTTGDVRDSEDENFSILRANSRAGERSRDSGDQREVRKSLLQSLQKITYQLREIRRQEDGQ